jgi:Tol biopolymer transport system component
MTPRTSLTAAMAAAALAAAAPAAHAAWPGVNGRISYTQRLDATETVRANRDFFAVALDGTTSRLTSDERNDEQSSWAPDGLRLAFKRSNESWILEALDGRGAATQITNDPGDVNPFNTQPAWSPDGTALIMRSSRLHPAIRVGDIMRVDADPTSPTYRSISVVLARPGDERYPTYSPDGSHIAFRGDDDGLDWSGDEELFIADADGTNIVQLTDNSAFDSAPAWSPDGTRLAFESDRDGDNEIYVMDLATREVTQLTDNGVHDEGPAWSPDGRFIAFTRAADRTAPGDIWVMNADGSEQRPLVTSPIMEESPDWQPLPTSVGAIAGYGRTACGDLSLTAGGVASIVAVKVPCDTARRVARAWEDGADLSAPPPQVEGFGCEARHHSFDQTLVECDHEGIKKGISFVYRAVEPPATEAPA